MKCMKTLGHYCYIYMFMHECITTELKIDKKRELFFLKYTAKLNLQQLQVQYISLILLQNLK